MPKLKIYDRAKMKKKTKADVTIGDAVSLAGSRRGYRLKKPANGGRTEIACLVEVSGVNPDGRASVRIVDSEDFSVRVSSLIGI